KGTNSVEEVQEKEDEDYSDEIAAQGAKHIQLECGRRDRWRHADDSTTKADQAHCDACQSSDQNADQNRTLYAASHEDNDRSQPDQRNDQRLAGQIAKGDHCVRAEPYQPGPLHTDESNKQSNSRGNG